MNLKIATNTISEFCNKDICMEERGWVQLIFNKSTKSFSDANISSLLENKPENYNENLFYISPKFRDFTIQSFTVPI